MPFPSRFHSKKPLAGTSTRRCRMAARNVFFSAAVSARALISSGRSFGFLAQDGTKPQRTWCSSRLGRLEPGARIGAAATTMIGWVGAML